jgi:uncharacterized membrane protein
MCRTIVPRLIVNTMYSIERKRIIQNLTIYIFVYYFIVTNINHSGGQ